MRLGRGLAFAAVHLGVTVGLVYWQEVPFWDYIPAVASAPRGVPHEANAFDTEDRPPSNACDAANTSERPMSSQEKILAIDNLPVALITGWHLPCSIPSRLDTLIQARYGFTQKAERVTGWIISALALVLWFIVGGFPMVRRRHRRWYTEPGIFMTLCTLVAMLLLAIGWSISRIPPSYKPSVTDFIAQVADVVTSVAALPMLFVGAGWVWWVGLFFYTSWKAVRRRINRRTRATESQSAE
jgi:hypothetical protein